jgi:hypothetical protein
MILRAFHALGQMYMKVPVLLILFAAFSENTTAQKLAYANAAGFRYQRGFIFQHKVDMDQLVTGHVSGWELFYHKQYLGLKPWEHFYRFPQVGVSLQYFDFNNHLLGKVYSLNPYISFPLKRSPRFEWHFRLSSGIGYFTRIFDLADNRKNGAIGSRLTGYAQFMMQVNWRIFPRIEFTGGLSMSHYSNGAWKVPNAGINFPGANVGLVLNIGPPEKVNLQSFPVIPKGWNFLIWTGWFGKETDPVNSGKYLAGSLGFNALKRFSGKASYGFGADLMTDWTLYKRRKDGQPEFPLRGGIALLYEFHLGRMSIPIQLGFYVFDPYQFDFPSYQRIGWRYKLNRSLMLNLTLKAHLNRADYLELGIGYVFGKH